jgi:hypothetical protein
MSIDLLDRIFSSTSVNSRANPDEMMTDIDYLFEGPSPVGYPSQTKAPLAKEAS